MPVSTAKRTAQIEIHFLREFPSSYGLLFFCSCLDATDPAALQSPQVWMLRTKFQVWKKRTLFADVSTRSVGAVKTMSSTSTLGTQTDESARRKSERKRIRDRKRMVEFRKQRKETRTD